MLDTSVKPYTDVADLFIIDPDGYIIRYIIKIIFYIQKKKKYNKISYTNFKSMFSVAW